MLNENYKDIIEEIFTEVTGTNFKFNYVIEEEVENNLNVDNQIIGVPNNKVFESNLDSKYSFENFMMQDGSPIYLQILLYIKRGIVADMHTEHKERGIDSITFAAPVQTRSGFKALFFTS